MSAEVIHGPRTHRVLAEPAHCRHCGVRIVACDRGLLPAHWASWAYGAAYCTGSLERQHEPRA